MARVWSLAIIFLSACTPETWWLDDRICRCSPVDAATAALYVMDGGSLDDTLGQHHGRLAGATPDAAPGMCDSAFVGGPDHWGVIPDDEAWDEIVSVDFWVWLPQANQAVLGIVSRDAFDRESNGHFDVSVEVSGIVQTRLQDLSADYFVRSSDPPPKESWLHVGVNMGPPGLEMWLNGDIVDTDVSVLSAMAGNTNPWVIGASSIASVEGSDELSGSNFAGGRIDELRLSTSRRDFSSCGD